MKENSRVNLANFVKIKLINSVVKIKILKHVFQEDLIVQLKKKLQVLTEIDNNYWMLVLPANFFIYFLLIK